MVSRYGELIMQGENFKQVFILAMSVALLIAIFVPLLLGVFKPSVFHGERLAGLQTIFFGIVIVLGLAFAGYLLIFFETSNAVLVEDRRYGMIFCLVFAALAAMCKLATRPRR